MVERSARMSAPASICLTIADRLAAMVEHLHDRADAMVSRNAMISAGTARRSAGSAIRRRRYAGLAIDCASPLIESERADALAASARAMPGLRSDCPQHLPRKDVPHLSESLSLESNRRQFVESPESIFLVNFVTDVTGGVLASGRTAFTVEPNG